MACLAVYFKSAGNIFANESVQLSEVEAFFGGETDSLYATAYVYADKIGTGFAFQRHGKANHTAFSCMAVRHNTYVAASSERLVT